MKMAGVWALAVLIGLSGCATRINMAVGMAEQLPDARVSILKVPECKRAQPCGELMRVWDSHGKEVVSAPGFFQSYDDVRLPPGVYQISMWVGKGESYGFPNTVMRLKPGMSYVLLPQVMMDDRMVRITYKEMPSDGGLSSLGSFKPVPVAQPKEVVQPLKEGVAKVRFISSVKGGALRLYPNDQCNEGTALIGVYGFGEAFTSLFNKPLRVDMLDPKGADDDSVTELEFNDGARVNFAFVPAPMYANYCRKSASFIAKAGEQYEVNVQDGVGQCVMTVVSLQKHASEIRRELVQDLQSLYCGDVSG